MKLRPLGDKVMLQYQETEGKMILSIWGRAEKLPCLIKRREGGVK